MEEKRACPGEQVRKKHIRPTLDGLCLPRAQTVRTGAGWVRGRAMDGGGEGRRRWEDLEE